MTSVRRLPVLLLVATSLATPLNAAESIAGRWASDPASCSAFFFSANAPLVVTDYAVRWRADSCRIARMYKTGATVHIQAQCWGEGGERSVPVSLRPHGGKLELRWDRVRTGDLKRCQ
ncbi:MAG: hypothetical protein ACK4UO_11010 [Pseudolabrys sp.]